MSISLHLRSNILARLTNDDLVFFSLAFTLTAALDFLLGFFFLPALSNLFNRRQSISAACKLYFSSIFAISARALTILSRRASSFFASEEPSLIHYLSFSE